MNLRNKQTLIVINVLKKATNFFSLFIYIRNLGIFRAPIAMGPYRQTSDALFGKIGPKWRYSKATTSGTM